MSQPTAASGDAAPATMRAVVVTRPGGLEVLEIKDVPVPVRKPGWVRIKVKAFGVNESEVTTRKGESDAVVTYPRVPGIEGVGVVDEADEDSGLRPGQQVATMMGGMGRSYDGSYAQYVTVPAAQVIPFETSLPWDVVGALPEMFQTAYGSLTRGLDLKAGQTLLIRGGTSTVGLSAATIAKDLGATVLSTTRTRCAGGEGGRGESGAVAEEAAEVRGVGEAEVYGHSAGVPPGASEQAPGFDQAPLVDEFTYPLAGGVPGGAAEGADRAAEQLGVVRGLVQFAKVQLQGVQEAPVPVGAARAGRGRADGGDARGVGQAQQQRFEQTAPQGVVDVEGAAPQRAVFVQELECRLLEPGGVVGVRAEHGRGLVRGERGQEAGEVGPQHLRFEQDERAAGRAGRMPAQHVPGTHPQPLAGGDGPRDVVDVVPQLTLGDRDEVVEGGPARTGRVPRPVVVLGEEVLDGTHFEAVGGTDRGLEIVQRNRDRSGRGSARIGVSLVDYHVSAVYRPLCRLRGKDETYRLDRARALRILRCRTSPPRKAMPHERIG